MFFASQAASENTMSIGVRNADADLAVECFRPIRTGNRHGRNQPRQEGPDLATIIVGENMKHTPGIAGKLSERWAATGST
ncbi:MAG: hypothetical protein ACLT1W_11680 [Alistipes onderdonkii]